VTGVAPPPVTSKYLLGGQNQDPQCKPVSRVGRIRSGSRTLRPRRSMPTMKRDVECATRQRQTRQPSQDASARALLCGRQMIVLQHPAQPLATDGRLVAPSDRGGWEEQQIAHALMVAFVMVVLRELVNGAAQ
jgi:hypothetical protein